MPTSIPSERLRSLNTSPVDASGRYVLYWMTAARRTRYNFALQHAANRAQELGVGLVVFEALRVDYPWASDRFHDFIIAGMRDNQKALAATSVRYYPYVEPAIGAAKGLLVALAERAALVVGDDALSFFLPRMLQRAAELLPVRLEVVEGTGIYPVRATSRVFTTAASFRRHLQKELPEHIGQSPQKNPLSRRTLGKASIARTVLKRWPEAALDSEHFDLGRLPIDHAVAPTATKGGPVAAGKALARFLDRPIDSYIHLRNQPESEGQSYLSSYLHFGHISAHEVFLSLMKKENWSPERIADRPSGSREGWWGASAGAEAYLDQLITWRELGHNMAALDPDYRKYESLPAWARATLDAHASDRREYLYSLEEFEAAQTHDPLWNAAQRQLLREGTIHNYLRMLWGKKILEWSASPRAALDIMIELNNKYALDGRDPNSYSGIFWILGRYDRGWGPQRPVFGSIRFMSSASTARKIRVRGYLEKFGP